MQGLIDYPTKPAFTWGNRTGFRAVVVTMPVPPGGCGAVIFIFWSRNNPVKYTDPDGRALPVLVIIAGKVAIGGAASAVVNYGSRVLGNIFHQFDDGVMLGDVYFEKALTDVNIGEVGRAFITGAIGGAVNARC
jgi:hypothetical protein